MVLGLLTIMYGNLLRKTIVSWWISLLHYDFDNVFAFKLFFAHNRDKLKFYLGYEIFTKGSGMFVISGLIFFVKLLIN